MLRVARAALAYARRMDAEPTPHIGTLHEGRLHADLKRLLMQEGDRAEVPVDDYVVDVVRGALLIEIQTGAFAPLRRKLEDLLERHRVRVVTPVTRARTVVRLDADGRELGRRRSPKKGRLEDVFERLVGLAPLLAHERLELELVVTDEIEQRVHVPGAVWHRKGWVVCGRALDAAVERRLVRGANDLATLLPHGLPPPFSTADLAAAAAMPRALAQQMLYCLTHAGAVVRVGKRGNSHLYRRVDG